MVTVGAVNIGWAPALASQGVTSVLSQQAPNITGAFGTSLGVGSSQAVVPFFAAVAAWALHIGLALAQPRSDVTLTASLRSFHTALAAQAGVWLVDGTPGVAVEVGGTLFTVGASSVVKAALAHTPANAPGGLVTLRVKTAALAMVVTLAASAGVGSAFLGRLPGNIVVEVRAAFTVHSCGVVLALAHWTHLYRGHQTSSLVRQAAISMTMAEAGSQNLHLF